MSWGPTTATQIDRLVLLGPKASRKLPRSTADLIRLYPSSANATDPPSHQVVGQLQTTHVGVLFTNGSVYHGVPVLHSRCGLKTTPSSVVAGRAEDIGGSWHQETDRARPSRFPTSPLASEAENTAGPGNHMLPLGL